MLLHLPSWLPQPAFLGTNAHSSSLLAQPPLGSRMLRGAAGCSWSNSCVPRAASACSLQELFLPKRSQTCSPRSSACRRGSLPDSAASVSPKFSLAAQQELPEGVRSAWQRCSLPRLQPPGASSPGGSARVRPAPAAGGEGEPGSATSVLARERRGILQHESLVCK